MAYCYEAGEAALCPAALEACEALCICRGGGSHSSSKEHTSKGTRPQPMQKPNLLKGCLLLPALTQGRLVQREPGQKALPSHHQPAPEEAKSQ